jgi:hypothetical protein
LGFGVLGVTCSAVAPPSGGGSTLSAEPQPVAVMNPSNTATRADRLQHWDKQEMRLMNEIDPPVRNQPRSHRLNQRLHLLETRLNNGERVLTPELAVEELE